MKHSELVAEKVVAAVQRHSREVVLSYSLFLSHQDKARFAAEKGEHEKILIAAIAEAVAEAVAENGGKAVASFPVPSMN